MEPVISTASPEAAAADQAMTSTNCKRQFKAAWAALRAGLTEEDIALAQEMRR